jgi:hypothetical protein
MLLAARTWASPGVRPAVKSLNFGLFLVRRVSPQAVRHPGLANFLVLVFLIKEFEFRSQQFKELSVAK